MNEEMQQSMEERIQAIEDALVRARWGRASEDDWFRIWYECGLSDRYPLKKSGEHNEPYRA